MFSARGLGKVEELCCCLLQAPFSSGGYCLPWQDMAGLSGVSFPSGVPSVVGQRPCGIGGSAALCWLPCCGKSGVSKPAGRVCVWCVAFYCLTPSTPIWNMGGIRGKCSSEGMVSFTWMTLSSFSWKYGLILMAGQLGVAHENKWDFSISRWKSSVF